MPQPGDFTSMHWTFISRERLNSLASLSNSTRRSSSLKKRERFVQKFANRRLKIANRSVKLPRGILNSLWVFGRGFSSLPAYHLVSCGVASSSRYVQVGENTRLDKYTVHFCLFPIGSGVMLRLRFETNPTIDFCQKKQIIILVCQLFCRIVFRTLKTCT